MSALHTSAVVGESSGSACGLSPDVAAGVWTQQHNNPGRGTSGPSEPHSRAKSAPSVLQETAGHWLAGHNE